MTRNAEVTAVKPMLAAKQIEWMKDDRLLVVAGNDSIMQVFRGEALFQMNVCDERRWLDMSSSPNKGVLAILDETHVLYTMTPADECPVNRTKVPNMDLIAVDNSGMNAVAAHANQVVRLSLAGDSILPLEVGDNRIEDVALSPSGEWVVASTESGSVLVWNSQQTAPFAQLTAHRERVSALQFNAESAQLMTASGRAGIRFWSFSIFDQSEELLRQKLNTAYRLALEDVIPPFPQ